MQLEKLMENMSQYLTNIDSNSPSALASHQTSGKESKALGKDLKEDDVMALSLHWATSAICKQSTKILVRNTHS